jgi:catechol 2,3-dioxygenase-like lactoylglutathione lyase family enzyme
VIIDHIGLAVSDYDASRKFFCQALAPLGIELIVQINELRGARPLRQTGILVRHPR